MILISNVSKLLAKKLECKCTKLAKISALSIDVSQKYVDIKKPVYQPKTGSGSILCGASVANLHRPFQNIKLHHQTRNFSTQSFVEMQQRIWLSISDSKLVAIFQDLLLTVHSTTGLPWWATIVLTSVLARTVVTFPLSMYQNYIIAKVENVGLEMSDIAEELLKETAVAEKRFNWTEKQANKMFKISLRKQWNKLIVRDNCHPLKASVLIWFQIPLWISLSFSLRNLVHMRPHMDVAAEITCTELSVGGFGWIPNLLEVDHSWILPVTMGVLNLAIIELTVMSKLRKPSKFQSVLTNLFRGFSVVLIPISASIPSCICLYWVSSSAYGFLQNLILLSPKVRRRCGVPITPSEIEQPYRHIYAEFRSRVSHIPGLKVK